MDQIKIGKLIQTQRIEKGLTQARLANKIGVSDRAVSKWENGRGLPDYEYIQDLCKELDITFNEFMAGEKIEAKDLETKLEENLIETYIETRKTNKKLITVRVLFLMTIVIIMFLIIVLYFMDSSYLNWDYSNRELAIAGTLLHGFEFVFVRIAPIVLLVSIIGIIITYKKK